MIDCAIILAVGSIVHQSQLIYNRPRPMLPALGKPLVVRMMDRLHRAGIRRYIVIIGETEGEVAAYLSTHWLPNVSVEFVLKLNSDPMYRTLLDVIRNYNQPFLITTYNSFTHGNFSTTLLKKHRENEFAQEGLVLSGAANTLSRSRGERWYAEVEAGSVKAVTRGTSAPSKKARILSDLALCGKEFLDFVTALPTDKPGHFKRQMMDVYQAYVEQGGSAQFAETAWTLPIESDYDLLTLNKHLLDEEQDAHILSELPYTVQVIPPVRIDPQVSVGQGAKIGPHVYLERGSSVGHDAVVRNTMVLQQSNVGSGEKIADTIIFSRGRITS